MKQLLYRYRHIWVLLYFPIYMAWFLFLERTVTTDSEYHLMHCTLDDKIPFCEFFIIPYLLWFAYILVVGLYLFFTTSRDFYRFCIFLFGGMSLSLLVCTLWPNGQALRPELSQLGRDNILLRLVGYLYETDTPTNVFPSIHVLNSIGACIAVFRNNVLKQKRPLCIATALLTVFICCSTVLLKQHSVLDVLGGSVLALLMYWVAYLPKLERIPEHLPQTEP